MDKENTNQNSEKQKKNTGRRILASNNLEQSIKNFSKPHFIGSYHLDKSHYRKNSAFTRLMSDELQIKVNKSIKSVVFNPVTKILIIIAILFNIFWFSLIYLL
jgi:Fe2+ transport system protein B